MDSLQNVLIDQIHILYYLLFHPGVSKPLLWLLKRVFLSIKRMAIASFYHVQGLKLSQDSPSMSKFQYPQCKNKRFPQTFIACLLISSHNSCQNLKYVFPYNYLMERTNRQPRLIAEFITL